MDEPTLPRWDALTTTEITTLVRRDPVVVLPVAAIEQHGPHLPLSTDLHIGLGLLRYAVGRLGQDIPVLVLPPLAIGASREHHRFPGTLSVEPELLGALVHQQGVSLAEAGVKRLLLSNSHGGNVGAIEPVALRLRDDHGMLVVKSHYFLLPPPRSVELPDHEWRHGIHGGAVETAMMLYLQPDLVHPERIGEARSLVGADLARTLRQVRPERDAVSFAWLAGDLDPSGVVGDARLADASLGQQLVAYYGQALAETIEDTHRFPLERLT